ncbi:putative non-specific serine/threonine protein kinase [Helianthus annuus]|uniref:Non-specific serine/threonine protein kinase n=2 Tax=Helianthus annuus TaxID=4232 RepID=A0A251S8S7_HELAN|nr:putative non-specific serine/threonine protein kinase [Helianthus annuus]KAJ0451312.1 putative non-specific serine/threonine protein kinase [Helianthus annuus]KAJ0455788.1 putative non-specific serine/threonine protein kinase [Helianthus annuus]KAJ0473188.1 putative non-specific serine/threonine protein kinase [Helianthus annuus]KAJ0652591.1 putative non-specific serine/threonine protein kinase [Helianthus annuus]
MERVEEFKVGDWVRVRPTLTTAVHGLGSVTPGSIDIVYCIRPDNGLLLELSYLPNPWHCEPEEVEHVEPFRIGDRVCVKRSVAEPRYAWGGETHHSVGRIIEIESDGLLIIEIPNRPVPWQADPSDIEKVEDFKRWKVSPGDAEVLSGFEVGDWARSKPSVGTRPSYDWLSIGKESLAVVHSVQDSGYLELACCFRKGKLKTHHTDIEKVSRLKIGQHVRFRAGLQEPRWGWRGAQRDSQGVIISVDSDGELRVTFFGVSGLWRGDPSDFEIEPTFEVGEWVRMTDNSSVWKSIGPGSIGVVQGIVYEEDIWAGNISVCFCGEQERWVGPSAHLEKVNKLTNGQRVRVKASVTHPRFGWSGHIHSSIGVISAIDADGKLRIFTPSGSKSWMLDPFEVEVVEQEELRIGDWVRVKPSVSNPTHHWGDVTNSSMGVVHRIVDDGLWVAFCFLERLWLCKNWEMERVRPFVVGDKVKIKTGLVSPRWGWGMETHTSKGQVVGVDANGKLRIKFQWREGKPWIGDPADIVHDETENPKPES